MGREILDKCGHVDILVNNAGFGLYGKVQNQSIEQIESVTFTNYLGVVYCTKVFLDSMIARKSGHIVNLASVSCEFWSSRFIGILRFEICGIRVF